MSEKYVESSSRHAWLMSIVSRPFTTVRRFVIDMKGEIEIEYGENGETDENGEMCEESEKGEIGEKGEEGEKCEESEKQENGEEGEKDKRDEEEIHKKCGLVQSLERIEKQIAYVNSIKVILEENKQKDNHSNEGVTSRWIPFSNTKGESTSCKYSKYSNIKLVDGMLLKALTDLEHDLHVFITSMYVVCGLTSV